MLSVLCVTQATDRAIPFLEEMHELACDVSGQFVLALDGVEFTARPGFAKVVHVKSEGFLESCLNEAITHCDGDYVLRLDDDERCPSVFVDWLKSGAYREHDSWFFPRYHVWPDRDHAVTSHPFFPDFQQRLTTKFKAIRPPRIHAGSPWPAYRAPVNFEHHTFLVKSYAERQAITAHYETIVQGRLFKPEEANVVAPEDWDLVTEAITPELQARANKITWWREVGQRVPPILERELREWVHEKSSAYR